MINVNTIFAQELLELGKKKSLTFGLLGVVFGGLTGILYIIDWFVIDTTLWVLSAGAALFMFGMIVVMAVITLFWILVVEGWDRIKSDDFSLLEYLARYPRLSIGANHLLFTIAYLLLGGVYLMYIFPNNPKVGIDIYGSSSVVGLSPVMGGLLIVLTIFTLLSWKEFYNDWIAED